MYIIINVLKLKIVTCISNQLGRIKDNIQDYVKDFKYNFKYKLINLYLILKKKNI